MADTGKRLEATLKERGLFILTDTSGYLVFDSKSHDIIYFLRSPTMDAVLARMRREMARWSVLVMEESTQQIFELPLVVLSRINIAHSNFRGKHRNHLDDTSIHGQISVHAQRVFSTHNDRINNCMLFHTLE